MDLIAAQVIDERHEYNQEKQLPIPGSIEKPTDGKQKNVPQRDVAVKKHPVEQKYHYQKKNKRKGVE